MKDACLCVSKERGDGEGAGTAGSQVLSLLLFASPLVYVRVV
jgi:hypothetical protein